MQIFHAVWKDVHPSISSNVQSICNVPASHNRYIWHLWRVCSYTINVISYIPIVPKLIKITLLACTFLTTQKTLNIMWFADQFKIDDVHHICNQTLGINTFILWHYFLVKNIFSAFSPILVVLHCYKRPDTSIPEMCQDVYNSVKHPKLVKMH